MVLESLINPLRAEQRPANLLFLGFLYSSVALFLSLWIFKGHSSLVMVFLTVIACVPLMFNTIKMEEKKDLEITNESLLLKEHSKALEFFMFLFAGFTLAYAFWYTVLPSVIIQDTFSTQMETIVAINPDVTGNAFLRLGMFSKILLNNLKVLIFCVLFAFIFGVGAIFILTWNASVIGVAIGHFVRSNLAKYADAVHLFKIGGYLQVVSIGLFRYVIHGIPEILAYFVGGLAGGIISIAVIRHDVGTDKFKNIVLDSSDLILIAIGLLLVGAFLEVYITPLIF